MTFKIQTGLPVKYALALHSALPSYPNSFDFLFDVASHIIRVTELKSKDWDPTDIKFSTKTLKYVFGEHMASDLFKDKIKTILKGLIASGTLIKKGEFIFIPETEFSKYYIIA